MGCFSLDSFCEPEEDLLKTGLEVGKGKSFLETTKPGWEENRVNEGGAETFRNGRSVLKRSGKIPVHCTDYPRCSHAFDLTIARHKSGGWFNTFFHFVGLFLLLWQQMWCEIIKYANCTVRELLKARVQQRQKTWEELRKQNKSRMV